MFHGWKLEGEDMSDGKNSHQANLDWQKWVGRVSGSEQQIQEALQALGREPRDAQELQREIVVQMEKNLGTVLR